MKTDRTETLKAVGQELATVLPDDQKPWWRTPHLLKLNLILGIAMLLAGTIGYDNSMMNGLQSLTQWQEFMDHPVGVRLGFINAIQALGTCISLPIMASLSNKYGRKQPIYIGLVILFLGVALQTCAKDEAMFITSRFLVGTASAFLDATPLLVTETAYPTHRGKMTALFNCFYYIGSLLAAWVTFCTRDYESSWAWRIPSLAQLAIPSVAIIGVLMCPESPRWLISEGRNAEAKAILINHHAGGDTDSRLVEFQMIEVESTLRMEREVSETTSYFDMIKTRGNRHRLLISVSIGVFAQWNGAGVVSYYLSSVLETIGITSVTHQTLINGFLQLWNLLLAIFGACAVDRLGRRFLLLTSSIGMLLSYIVITGLSGSFASTQSPATGLAVIPMLFIYYAFYDIGYTPLVISYPAEIWPYHLRSRGFAIATTSTFLALFFSLLVNPIALKTLAWKYYIVYIVILVGICVTVWAFYPETRGRSLEEIKLIFDGVEAVEGGRRKSEDDGSEVSEDGTSIANERVVQRLDKAHIVGMDPV